MTQKSYSKKGRSLTNEELLVRFNSDEAELALLNIMLNDDSYVPKVMEWLPKHDMMGNPMHQDIYKTILDMYFTAQKVDMITVGESVKHLPNAPMYIIEKIAANSSLPMHIGDVAKTTATETYGRIVRDKYLKRQTFSALFDDKDDSLAKAQALIEELNQKNDSQFFKPGELAKETRDALAKPIRSEIQYPFTVLNKATNGIHKGQMVVVAGRPGAGKSTMTENIASFAAMQGYKVLFATAEMSAVDIGKRIVIRQTETDVYHQAQRDPIAVEEALKRIAGSGLHILQIYTVAQLEKELKEKGDNYYDLVCVDYLQLLEAKKVTRDTFSNVREVANELNRIAKEKMIPMVVCAQMNREGEKNNQPTMGNLKESGQIEQNADVIISLWQNKNDPVDPSKQKVRIDLLKNRNGMVFGNSEEREYFLWFNKPIFKFIDPLVENIPKWGER